MIILNAVLEDAEELLNIYAPYVSDTAVSFEYDIPDLEEFRGRLVSISAHYPYLKAVEGEHIVGYAYASAFKNRSAYDWSVESTIYLRQAARGKGIGRELYSALEAELRHRGFLNMNACIAVPISEDDPFLTDASRSFHLKQGFSEVGIFHKSGYKFGRWYDMVWMEKLLGDHSESISRPLYL